MYSHTPNMYMYIYASTYMYMYVNVYDHISIHIHACWGGMVHYVRYWDLYKCVCVHVSTQVPHQYQLLGYSADPPPALGTFIPPCLPRPLRTGAEVHVHVNEAWV